MRSEDGGQGDATMRTRPTGRSRGRSAAARKKERDSRRKTIATRPRDRKTPSGRSGSRFLPGTLALRNPVAAVAEEERLAVPFAIKYHQAHAHCSLQ